MEVQMKLFFGLMASIGSILAASASTGCLILVFDEPDCPTELL